MKPFGIAAIAFLITFGASAQESLEVRLMKSALRGDADGVRQAISAGADVNAQLLISAPSGTPFADAHVQEFDVPDGQFALADGMAIWTPLEGAAETNRPDIMRMLIDAGSDANRGHIASSAFRWESREAQIPVILSAELNGETRSRIWFGLLSESRKRDMAPIARRILDSGFDAAATLSNGETVLEAGNRLGADEAILALLKARGASFSFDSPLVGTWLYPAMDGVPGGVAKMTYRPDGTGLVYDRSRDVEPMDDFIYEFMAKDDDGSLYRIVQTYEPDNFWYALVFIQAMDGFDMLFWYAWGQNVDSFPEWGQSVPIVWNGVSAAE